MSASFSSKRLKKQSSSLRVQLRRRLALQKDDLLPKLTGLPLLKQTVKGLPATVLPYRVIRNPASFSFARLGSVSERILVRSDDAFSTGISESAWRKLPRKTFVVNQKNPAETELEVRVWMEKELTWMKKCVAELQRVKHDWKADSHLFFIVHPLRAEKEYRRVGSLLITAPDQQWVRFGPAVPGAKTFRHLLGPSLRYSDSSSLSVVLETVAMRLFRRGVKQAELSFVTYVDAPEVPEFYDLLIGKKREDGMKSAF